MLNFGGGGGGGLRNNHCSIKCFVMNQILSKSVCSVDVIVATVNFQLLL